ncbi:MULTISPECIES: trypsin-like peptidase domain-containing protein [unclassified Amycolatopsis]|uniref:S1C family serine protease n=1 Tax=unclassified Amycolatopsis TaxID=2618356 RepID=UPI0028749C9E|nr:MULTISPECIES: trypsin-like peptidase domain-containing protein [unclassified Amycolatopsis]MDS0132121.1 trypsin-like peptidase domain-containing protein [Amycolatopsis sp. 505]MDS0141141.1 trypsin-like peptidase domain-containing protein [Amycolatopsis sp. CM201R]
MSEYDRGPQGGGEYPYGYGQGGYSPDFYGRNGYPQDHGYEQPQYRRPGEQGYYEQPRDQWGRPYPAYAYPQPAYQPPPRKRHPFRALSFAIVAIALAVVAGLGIGHLISGTNAPTAGGNQNFGFSGQPSETKAVLEVDAVSAKVNPAIVNINTELGLQGAAAAGTGIVLTADGEVLTNNHVVAGATSIKVTSIGTGDTYQAEVVGYDRTEDVAVLQLQDASGLLTASIGDSSTTQVGDQILGLGNAGGRGGDPVPAPGTVTALDQSITASDESSGSSEQLTGLIQVRANIESGDSGGPLVNANAQVIGVNTAASTGYQLNGRRSGGTGQGFAIPINQAVDIAHKIVAGQATDKIHIGKTAFIGVSVTDGQGGARVREVVQRGPAQKAGLAAGDVITAIDGKPVTSATTLTNVMDTHHPGDQLTLTVTRATGGQQQIQVKAIEGPTG